jgi:hypothetical protein
MIIKYIALSTDIVQKLINGEPDANGQMPEKSISDGAGNPCRHCLQEIPLGEPMLTLAYRPFGKIQPYAEVGPIFLCANQCERYQETAGAPDLYHDRDMLIRGYDTNDRIIYGTGKVVPVSNLEQEIPALFDLPSLSYVHARSPTNNCYHFRIEPGPSQGCANPT